MGPARRPEEVAPILRGLDDDQLEAVTSSAQVLKVIAGAGSGKTRVLTHRVAYRVATGSAEEARCLVVTFTRAAAAELSTKLRALGAGSQATAGTLHSTAWSLLRGWLADRGRSEPTIVDRAELLGRIARRVHGPRWRPDEAAPGELAELMSLYSKEKHRRSVVDFDDVIARCGAIFEEDRRYAEAQRWRFRHIFVDEIQDLTPAQFNLLVAWAGKDADLFMVGDPRQAVYEWNGSDPRLIDRISERFPTAVTVSLDRNYRCSPEIQRVARAFLNVVDGSGGTARGGTSTSSAPPGTEEASSSPTGHNLKIPTVARLDTPEVEAGHVITLLRKARARGLPWREMAVLTRTKGSASLLATRLEEAAIPVTPLTIHKAKGLEWSLVVVAACEMLPLVDGAAEEARLFYVALTRASEELHLTAGRREGSTWLDAVQATCRDMERRRAPVAPDSAREHLRAARAALGKRELR